MKKNTESASPALEELLAPEQEEKTELFPGITTEEIKAVYFDKNALREPPYRIYQLNTEGYRYYYRYDEKGELCLYPSVTTLLRQTLPTSPFLIDWIAENGKEGAAEKRDLAAAYGTFMHIQLERLIINRTYDFDQVPALLLAYIEQENLPEKFFAENIQRARKDVLAFAQFVVDYNVRPLAVEIGLCHPDYHYAGCVDLPCIMTDKKTKQDFRAIVDFKSGRKGFYEEHELQLELYRLAWNVNFPDLEIERTFNWSPKDWRTSPTYNLKEQTGSKNIAKVPHLLALAAIEDDKRDNTITLVHGSLNLDNWKAEDNVLTLTLSELIKSKADKKAEKSPEVPEKGAETRPESTESPEVINLSPEGQKPAESKFSDKLPKPEESLLNSEIDL